MQNYDVIGRECVNLCASAEADEIRSGQEAGGARPGFALEKCADIARRSCFLRHLAYTYGGKAPAAQNGLRRRGGAAARAMACPQTESSR